MNAGVSTTPCASVSRPRRAEPAVFSSWNSAVIEWGSCVRGGRWGDEHGVTIAEKAVLPGDRVPIRGEHRLATGERADQHEQRGFGQVEVRQHRVDDAE